MKIAVFGVGGVGGYFGWRLVQAGQDVVFVARGENYRALSARGLIVETPDGNSCVQHVRVVEDPQECGELDAILLGVKTWQVSAAAQAIGPLIGSETFVVPLQNGVEAPSQLAEVLGWDCVFGGLCYIVALKVGPGHIRHAGMEPFIAFGELNKSSNSSRGKPLLEAFLAANVKAEIPSDIEARMWEKFLFIGSLSGVAAVTRAPVGVIRSVPETRLMLEQVAREIASVAAARGVPLDEDAVQKTLALIDQLPASATTSMQRDIMDGRPSELSAHNGAVTRIGAEIGMPAPLNASIYASLLPLERRARGEVDF